MQGSLRDKITPLPMFIAYAVTSVIAVLGLIIGMTWWFTTSEHSEKRFEPQNGNSLSAKEFRDVGIQMFQWPWTAVAQECRNTLGTMGIRRVLISPPHENLNIPTWTSSYAPVSYKLNSKLGSREEFAAMVQECGRHGVDIIADAVMNHMSPVIPPYTGIDGTTFSQYNYPGPGRYSYQDFHHCTFTPDGVMRSYQDRGQVQECDALALPDLNTSSPHVLGQLNSYLQDLLNLGVAGFRIDAAKHIAAADVAKILDKVPADKFVVQEVIPGIGETIKPEEYLDTGRVFDFAFAGVVADALKYQDLPALFSAGSERGLIGRSHAVPIVTNHDLERDVPDLLNYTNGWRFYFANLLMLATDHGGPFLYTGYAFTERDAPSPMTPGGYVKEPHCAINPFRPAPAEFSCMQRLPAVATMVQWRLRAMSGELAPPANHTSDVPILSPAQIIWRGDGAVALLRNGLLFAANVGDAPVQIPLNNSLTDTSTLRSLRGHEVSYDGSVLTVKPFDIVVSMRPR
ncbi:MAG TPA: alpha-amylase [Corynebacteriales bacterium]|nr:alpha-amylase [Mycobacteriales bacterium]